MPTSVCHCCGEARRIVADLRRRPATVAASAIVVERGEARQALCARCHEWLTSLVRDVRQSTVNGDAPILGAPVVGSRSLVFDDQCHLCREIVTPSGSLVECVARTAGVASWEPMLACLPCDGWLASLADDGRSARGEATRVLDGEYGQWLHPNLAGTRVTIDIRDEVTKAVVEATCRAMGVVTDDDGERGSSAPVLVVEAHHPDRATALIRAHFADPAPAAHRTAIVVAPLSARVDLAACLGIGATDWLTIPLTPQQLTAALVRARSPRPVALGWDSELCLPVVQGDDYQRPALCLAPRAGHAPFEVAWAVRRFSRGYDDLVATLDGRMLLILRSPHAAAPLVRARLMALIGDRCSVELREQAPVSPRARFELAG